jgi:carboxyl-terminal processing protease
MIDENIGYARLTGFVQTSGADLEKEINIIEEKYPELKGFILDLRGNPGGLLTAAVEVSQIFLQKDETVVSIKGRHGDDAVFKTQATSHKKWPLVILIDGGSASASEIVAGAIRDNRRGILIGTKSFGKGSVQTVLPLNDGSALALTTAYYYTPGNHLIHKKGISPDIEVQFPKLTNEQLKEYRDELEKLSLSDYEQTKIKQDEFLQKQNGEKPENTESKIEEKSADKSTETTGVVADEKTEEAENSDQFMPIHSQDIQLQRAVEVLRAVDIFYNNLIADKK